MINGLCSQCPKGQLYDSSTSKCVTAFYSTSTDSSVLSPCQPNQIVVNGSCQCDQNSISLGDRCVPCPHGSYKAGNQCRNCSDYCTNCVNLTDCSQCQNGFNLINAQCSEVCGDGRRFVLFCDDGNTVSGDGCSSACQIEAGYICFGGSPISTDLCQPTNPNDKTLTISVDPGYPIYTTMGIITNFDINPPVARTDDDLRNMFEITFTP
jgi:cysteine-rich repeat protein